MKEMFKRMFDKWFCLHKWNLYHSTKGFEKENSTRPFIIEHTLICDKCGKITKIKV